MTSQEKLEHAVEWLKAYYTRVPVSRRKGWCLRDTRAALTEAGLRIPWNAYPHNLAFSCFEDLKANPGRWQWQQIHHPLPRYSLVFFGGCGYLKDGRMAGHIGILDNYGLTVYSNVQTPMSKWWSARLKGAFVPKG